jgi:hypothetical protein
MNELFWLSRDAFKSGVDRVTETLKLVEEIGTHAEVITEEEKIFLYQVTFWLKYLQSRHHISDEKLTKQKGPR